MSFGKKILAHKKERFEAKCGHYAVIHFDPQELSFQGLRIFLF